MIRMDKELTKKYRLFLKDSIRKVIDFSQTDQNRGIAPPPIEKPYPREAKKNDLPKYDQFKDIIKIDLKTAIIANDINKLTNILLFDKLPSK